MKTLDKRQTYHFCAINATKTGTGYTDGIMHTEDDPTDNAFLPRAREFIASLVPGKPAAKKVAILSLTLIAPPPAGAGSGSAPDESPDAAQSRIAALWAECARLLERAPLKPEDRVAAVADIAERCVGLLAQMKAGGLHRDCGIDAYCVRLMQELKAVIEA